MPKNNFFFLYFEKKNNLFYLIISFWVKNLPDTNSFHLFLSPFFVFIILSLFLLNVNLFNTLLLGFTLVPPSFPLSTIKTF